MLYDVILVGGSFAGHAAALQLGRARKRVLFLDTRRPRNRFAMTSHGFLGLDGRTPNEIHKLLTGQLARYSTVEVVEAEAVDAAPIGEDFRVTLADGQPISGRRLILATGVRDILPEIAGIEERWGVSILYCPYCHGYEMKRRPLGVLADGQMTSHRAMLVSDWGPTTLFTQGLFTPSKEEIVALEKRGVTLEVARVTELLGESPKLEAVRLEDGRLVEVNGLFVAPRTEQSSDLATKLGCVFEEGPTGPIIRVNERNQTSIPGVFAAGDACSPMPNATLAAASGLLAGISTHQSLLFPNLNI